VPAIPDNLKGAWGAENADTAEILIPKILLMQGLSEMVQTGKVAQGDILKSTTKEVIAKKGEAVEFIPISTYATWMLEEYVKNKWEYRGTVPRRASEADLPFEYQEGERQMRRSKATNFYVLLVGDIQRDLAARKSMAKGDLADPNDVILPCVLTFRRTGFVVGKTLTTHFAKSSQLGMPPAASVFKLSATTKKNDKGIFQLFDLAHSRHSTVEEMGLARAWYDTIRTKDVKVDDAVEAPDEAAQATATADARDSETF
jgi:hypothetical protein